MSVKLGHQLWRQAFPGGLVGKESACNARDVGSSPGLGRSSGEGKGYPLQYSGLENSPGLCSPWGCKASDVTERLSLSLSFVERECLAQLFSNLCLWSLRVIGMIRKIPLRSLQSQNLVYYLFSLLTFVFMVQKQW